MKKSGTEICTLTCRGPCMQLYTCGCARACMRSCQSLLLRGSPNETRQQGGGSGRSITAMAARSPSAHKHARRGGLSGLPSGPIGPLPCFTQHRHRSWLQRVGGTQGGGGGGQSWPEGNGHPTTRAPRRSVRMRRMRRTRRTKGEAENTRRCAPQSTWSSITRHTPSHAGQNGSVPHCRLQLPHGGTHHVCSPVDREDAQCPVALVREDAGREGGLAGVHEHLNRRPVNEHVQPQKQTCRHLAGPIPTQHVLRVVAVQHQPLRLRVHVQLHPRAEPQPVLLCRAHLRVEGNIDLVRSAVLKDLHITVARYNEFRNSHHLGCTQADQLTCRQHLKLSCNLIIAQLPRQRQAAAPAMLRCRHGALPHVAPRDQHSPLAVGGEERLCCVEVMTAIKLTELLLHCPRATRRPLPDGIAILEAIAVAVLSGPLSLRAVKKHFYVLPRADRKVVGALPHENVLVLRPPQHPPVRVVPLKQVFGAEEQQLPEVLCHVASTTHHPPPPVLLPHLRVSEVDVPRWRAHDGTQLLKVHAVATDSNALLLEDAVRIVWRPRVQHEVPRVEDVHSALVHDSGSREAAVTITRVTWRQGNLFVLPVHQVLARHVAPVHRTPLGTVRVVLVENMVVIAEIHQPRRVVHPPHVRAKVIVGIP
ncbi:sucrose hydrolase-like protein [Leishmania tarentolae]|uniref:Sucrose hydrolase-like protein n=1 Tax=Leishmania tarentolae TaxID=5689 RepID=A0A640KHS2_LEITA|nr:sucrose hydrolase-like protein [Leishmania tarentolae]